MSEKIQKILIDTGSDGEYRVAGSLNWCDEHGGWESEAFHNALKVNPDLLKEIDED